MRFLFSYGVAFVIIVAIAAWMATGTLIQGGQGPGKGERPVIELVESHDGPIHNAMAEAGVIPAAAEGHGTGDPALTIAQREAAVSGAEAPARSVRIETFTAKAMAIEVPLRGQTKASSTVTASSETTGIVADVHVVKGQTVKTGDLLCTLDQGTRQANVAQAQASLSQAEANLEMAQADVDTNAALRKKGLAAENTARQLEVGLSAAQAGVSAAQSALDNARAELARTQILAKSDGIVQDPLATTGSMLAAGAPCATIVQLDPIIFAGMVPEARIGLAKLGLEASISTVTGQSVDGKVSYIASTADPATRAFPVEIEIPNADGVIRAGTSAEATVKIGTAPAQLLPQSVLTLDDAGTLGVRAVEDAKVVFYPVTILRDTREGVWVSGLPLKLDVITVGQEFVQPGQPVKADYGTGDAPATTADAAEEAHS